MADLTIVAAIQARADRNELAKAELQKLVGITRGEDGCIQYDLHPDNEDPAHFMLYANRESRELWQTHMNAPHLATYVAATDGAIGTFMLNEMTKVT